LFLSTDRSQRRRLTLNLRQPRSVIVPHLFCRESAVATPSLERRLAPCIAGHITHIATPVRRQILALPQGLSGPLTSLFSSPPTLRSCSGPPKHDQQAPLLHCTASRGHLYTETPYRVDDRSSPRLTATGAHPKHRNLGHSGSVRRLIIGAIAVACYARGVASQSFAAAKDTPRCYGRTHWHHQSCCAECTE